MFKSRKLATIVKRDVKKDIFSNHTRIRHLSNMKKIASRDKYIDNNKAFRAQDKQRNY